MASEKAAEKKEIRKEKDINVMLKVMEAASAIRMQNLEASRQLDFDEVKEDLKNRILETSKVTGEQLTDEEVNAAIKSYLSGLYCFKEPKKGLGYSLTNLYVERDRIRKKYGKPALAVLGGAMLLWAGAKGISSMHAYFLERNVEVAVEREYQEKQKLKNEITAISSQANEKFEEADELKKIAAISADGLNITDDFFKKFCSNGTASDDINQNNYREAGQQLKSVDKSINAVKGYVGRGKGIVELQQGIVTTRRGLESLIQEIRNDRPPKVLSERAEIAYQNGIVSLDKRQLSQGQNYKNQLAEVKKDAQQFAILPSQADQLYTFIKSTAKEPEAIAQAEKLHNEAAVYINSVNVPQLRQSVDNLKNLDDVLNQEYTLRIVSREDVKSGIDRYYEGRLSGYYLIVEAIDARGNVVKKQIKNEENGRVYTVEMWGEKVPESIYERVKQDKIDDGIIQDNVFGTKQKGYLNETVKMKGVGTKAGQITEW